MIAELENITKIYTNKQSGIQREVLKGITLSINKGDALSIVGPSGCGKSTLLNILGTLDMPTSGVMRFNGKEINNLTDNQLADIRNREIGFIFQAHHLLPQLNLLENVLLPTLVLKERSKKKLALERALHLLENVGLANNIKQLPGQLSGGECQRAAVVRALINEPELILADEPTGSLDKNSAERIGELLSEINKTEGVSLVVVTHSLSLANKIGNTYNLSEGRITIG
jgi:lipoprotein-releasing system ATP-binding protein